MAYVSRRISRFIRMWPVCAAAALVVACGTVQIGHDFELRAFERKVQQGVTTQADVRGWLGAPTNTGVAVDERGERHAEWTYYFAHGRLSEMAQAKLKTLRIRFDSRGTVLTYSWSRSGS